MAWQQSIQAAVRELRKEEVSLRRKLAEIQARIKDLEAIGTSNAAIKSGAVRKKTGSRRLSAEGRAAISKAAKKRWAKYRRSQKQSR